MPECFTDVSTCEAHSGAISVFEFAVLMRLPCLLETLDVASHASGRSMGQAMEPCLRRQLPCLDSGGLFSLGQENHQVAALQNNNGKCSQLTNCSQSARKTQVEVIGYLSRIL